MGLIGLIIVTVVLTAIVVPRIRRRLPAHAAIRRAGSGTTAEPKW